MSIRTVFLALSAVCAALNPAMANDRYRERPPIVVSPDLTAPWVTQLGRGNVRPVVYPQPPQRHPLSQRRDVQQRAQVVAARPNAPRLRIDPQFLPQIVNYDTNEAPGTIVIDTPNRLLYLVLDGGKARRYGVGVGKPGFEWAGTHSITRKTEWPTWTPPKEMITREAAKGHYLPAFMEGGPENPMGARAMYLGSTLYRIHGTNQPWSIGQAMSSGCVRMLNHDVIDLYERVKVGGRVHVIQGRRDA